jgi:hypothetical protein
MFQSLQLEVMDRFTAVEQHFRKSPKQPSDVGQTAKGLVFVQIYGIYEYTTRTATRLAIAEMVSQGKEIKNLKPSLLAVFLDAEINSLRAVGEDKQWDRRIALFEKALSAARLPLVNAIPHDGSHFKYSQLQMLFRTLGIRNTITIRKRHKYQLDEIVVNRNRIAHGEETALEVGRNYSRKDIRHRIKITQALCLRVIFLISQHCSNPRLYCK